MTEVREKRILQNFPLTFCVAFYICKFTAIFQRVEQEAEDTRVYSTRILNTYIYTYTYIYKRREINLTHTHHASLRGFQEERKIFVLRAGFIVMKTAKNLL